MLADAVALPQTEGGEHFLQPFLLWVAVSPPLRQEVLRTVDPLLAEHCVEVHDHIRVCWDEHALVGRAGGSLASSRGSYGTQTHALLQTPSTTEAAATTKREAASG